MSLMNDALRKRARERRGPAAGHDRVAAARRPTRSTRWVITASLVVLLTAAAFGGLHLVQATTGGDLIVKDRASADLATLPRPLAAAPVALDQDEPKQPIGPPPTNDTAHPRDRQTPAARTQAAAAGESATNPAPHIAEEQTSVSERTPLPVQPPSAPARTHAPSAVPRPRESSPHQRAAVSRRFEPGPGPAATSAAKPAIDPSEPAADEASLPSRSTIDRPVSPPATADSDDQFYQKALAYHRSGRIKDAIALYNQVLVNRPNHPGALLNLSGAYLQNGSFSAAYPLLERLRQSASPPKGVLLNMAIAAIGLGDPQEALVWLDRAQAAADATPWDIRFHRAVAYARMNHLDDALALYQASEADRPDDSRVKFNLAITYDAMGRYQEALSRYQAVLDSQAATDRATIIQRMGTLRRYIDNRSSASTGH